jgi:hypothetical protein
VYARLYDRLCGWLLVGLGIAGFACGGVPGYIRLETVEAWIHVAMGLILVGAGRSRHRNAVLASVWVGALLFLWGILGLSGSTLRYGLGHAEPLEGAVHLVAGAWGMYIAVQDVLDWRRS